jgi:hypothetical protein
MFYQIKVTRELDNKPVTNGEAAANAVLEIANDLDQLKQEAQDKGKASGKWNGYTFRVERVD